ncbi:hypothetical protein GQ457_12G025000 [Hibiscus cannabinus]
MVKRQFGFEVKIFRSDNAPELKFTELFAELGIVHQFSYVETPQQNVVVERKHQHLLAIFNPGNELIASGSVDTVPKLSLQGHSEEIPTDVVHNSFNAASSSHQSPSDDNSHVPDDNSHISNDNSGPQTSPVPVDNPQVFVQPQRVVRHSTRVSQKPSYLKQYYCNTTVSKSLYPIKDYVSSSRLSPEYSFYIANVSSIFEPAHYHQAVQFPEWKDAMHEELQAMENNKTWSVVTLPEEKQTIDCKWVYRVKYKVDGTLDRYKARLVAKGFTQVEEVDYTYTFSLWPK